tara:strand:+ start:18219 stop:19196 length:978 start_codon:yes stop_codon:yes gene_type:complete
MSTQGTPRSLSDLIVRINDDLADNNAGLITAEDVRQNMLDVAASITTVVGSGDFHASTPFLENVKIKSSNPETSDAGSLIVGSGIRFENNGDTFQYIAYPGANNISHNDLDDLDQGDAHTQYIPINGSRHLTANMATDNNWINASGSTDNPSVGTYNDRGLKFEYVDATNETIHVGDKSTVDFNTDNSKMSSAKGVAKAWMSFGWDNTANSNSGANVINESFNIASLERIAVGQYKITFSTPFPTTKYVAIGTSNGRTGGSNPTDFENNTVGIVDRATTHMVVAIISDDHAQSNNYVDAAVVDVIVYGLSSGESSETTPTITDSV